MGPEHLGRERRGVRHREPIELLEVARRTIGAEIVDEPRADVRVR
jgi:hypothetical protein